MSDSFEFDIDESPVKDSQKYFDERGKFNSSHYAKDLADYLNILTPIETQEIYYWNDGCYRGGASGEGMIRAQLPIWLGENYTRISPMMVNDIIGRLRAYSSRHEAIFDVDLELLPLENGVLNINTLEFEDYRKDKHHFRFQLPVSYDPDAMCPHFAEFVSEIVYPADIPVIQEIFGYCLWREGTESIKKAIMLLGDGDNGKSLLMDILKNILGSDNVCADTLVSLSETRFARAQLRDKLANINPDIPDRALKETGIFKALLGDDLINAELKHGPFFRFINRAKLVFSANKLPESRDDSPAFYGRWEIVSFPYRFVKSTKKKLDSTERPAKNKNKLKKQLMNELPGILNWSLHGLKRLRENDDFTDAKSVEEMREFYQKMSNNCIAFTDDECLLTGRPEDSVTKDDFYNRYVSYCESRHIAPVYKKEYLGRNIPSWFAGKISQGRVGKDRAYSWLCVRFKNEEEKANDQQTLDGAS